MLKSFSLSSVTCSGTGERNPVDVMPFKLPLIGFDVVVNGDVWESILENSLGAVVNFDELSGFNGKSVRGDVLLEEKKCFRRAT